MRNLPVETKKIPQSISDFRKELQRQSRREVLELQREFLEWVDKVGWLPIRGKIYRQAAIYLYRLSEREERRLKDERN